jgi:lysophospholipid acyltransferase (LPLAT)-like uncharacterized protein
MNKRLKYAVVSGLLPPFVYLLILTLKATYRVRHVNREPAAHLWQAGETSIVCFWHGRLFSVMPFASRLTCFKILISRHGDGEFITRVVRYFGIGAVRGSYRKQSVASVREIIAALRHGTTVGITPDGPKGPRHVFKEGIVEIARITQKPIVLITYGARRAKTFGSWDRFLLPYPFSRLFVLWSDPIYIPKDSSRSEIESKRQDIEKKLVTLTEQADSLACGK